LARAHGSPAQLFIGQRACSLAQGLGRERAAAERVAGCGERIVALGPLAESAIRAMAPTSYATSAPGAKAK